MRFLSRAACIAPRRLRLSYPRRGKIIDAMRDLSNRFVRLDRLMRLTFATATRVFVTTRETGWLLPRSARGKSVVAFQNGSVPDEAIAPRPVVDDATPIRVLFAGRLLYWKGLHLALRAVARADRGRSVLHRSRRRPRRGLLPRRRGRTRSRRCRLAGRGGAPRDAAPLRRARPFLVSEPSRFGRGRRVRGRRRRLPGRGLELGFAREIPVDEIGVAVPADDASEDEVAEALALALVTLARDRGRREVLGRRARLWVREVEWPSGVGAVYAAIERSLAPAAGDPRPTPIDPRGGDDPGAVRTGA